MSIEVPDYLKTGPMAEAAAKSLRDAASMASASISVPRVSLRGREFRFVVNGEEVKKVRDSVDVVILGVEPEAGRMIKTYYEKGYQPGTKEPPTCSSDDGVAPSPWVTNRVSQTCAQCPKNAFGSAVSPTGKATKACRDSKRIWIVLADDPEPIPDRTVYGLNVTVASLKAFSELGRQFATYGQPPAVAVTRITMMDTEFPQLEFEVAKWVAAEEAQQTLALANDRPWRLLSGAGIALSMGEPVKALPTSLPAQVQAPAADQPTKPVSKDVDDDIANW